MHATVYFCVSCLQLSSQPLDRRQRSVFEEPPHQSTSTDDMVS